MYLKELVGKLAIRTSEPLESTPYPEFEKLIQSFGIDVGFRFGSEKAKYMDEPVKIVNVKEQQVAIEYHGKRQLLERRYIDEHWADYEKFLNPEKEEDLIEGTALELMAAAKPLKRLISKLYNPDTKIVVTGHRIQVFMKPLSELITDEEKEDEMGEENE
jgi:hypothetical protein|uniref:Uncharacterized protein n=1 Tax=Siphoviridae sp. ctVOP12 TaxID=2825531 RepID=A0A8S5V9V4_9CAUD|nr:MAG TPA: hypothetical protein [Siphoviridae sp. ctVOP12]